MKVFFSAHRWEYSRVKCSAIYLVRAMTFLQLWVEKVDHWALQLCLQVFRFFPLGLFVPFTTHYHKVILKEKKAVCNLDFSLGTADFISTEGWSFGWKLWIVSLSINKEWNPLMSCSNDLMNVVLGQNINKLQANKCCHFPHFSQLQGIQNIKTWMSRIKGEKMRWISLNSCRNESIVSQSFCHAFPVSSPSVKIIIQLGSWTKRMESCDVCNGMLCDLVFSIYLNPDVQIQHPHRSFWIHQMIISHPRALLNLHFICKPAFTSLNSSFIRCQMDRNLVRDAWPCTAGSSDQDHERKFRSRSWTVGSSDQGYWSLISLIQGTSSPTENKAIFV